MILRGFRTFARVLTRAKERPPAGHSRSRMRAFSSIEITLGVGITLGVICAARHASAAACRPGVRLDGDAALVGVVGAALGERGIATAAADDDPARAAACTPARVTLQRRDDRIAVSIAGREPAVAREVTDARTATTVIESWVRVDVEEPLLASRTVAMAAPRPPAVSAPPAPAPPATTTTITAPPPTGGRGVQLFALAERSIASDGTAWLGLQLGACVALGPFCLGGRARFAVADGPQLQQDDLERHGFELLFDGDLPVHFGRATLSPGLGIGIGSVHTHQKGTGQSESTGGPHAEAHVSLLYGLRPHLALEFAMSFDVTETTHVESSSAVMLPDEPEFFARFGAGVRFGGL